MVVIRGLVAWSPTVHRCLLQCVLILCSMLLSCTSGTSKKSEVTSSNNSSAESVRALSYFLDTINFSFYDSQDWEALFQEAQRGDDFRLRQYAALMHSLLKASLISDYHSRMVAIDSVKLQQRNPISIATALHFQAQLLYNEKEYVPAFKAAIEAYQLFEEIGFANIPEIGKYLQELSVMHYFFKDYTEVIRLMNLSFQYPSPGPTYEVQRYNNLALAHKGLNNLNKAKEYWDLAFDKAKKHSLDSWQGILAENIAGHYVQLHEFEEARKLHDYVLSIIDSLKSPVIHGRSLLCLAEINLLEGNLSDAGGLLQRFNALEKPPKQFLGFQQQYEKLHIKYFKLSRDYWFQMGDFKQAYLLGDSFHVQSTIHDSIHNVLQLSMIKQQMEREQYQLKAALDEQAQKILSYQYTGLLLCIVIAFGGAIYRLRKKKKEEKRAFSVKEMEHLEKEKVLTEKIETLEQKIQRHLEEIKVANLQLAQSKQLQNPSSNLLLTDSISNRADIENSELRILTKEAWEQFRSDFQQLNPSFAKKLQKHPAKFSEAESRLLMLAKLKCSAKDICNILGVSDNSVRVTWHRVRKKMNLPPEAKAALILKSL